MNFFNIKKAVQFASVTALLTTSSMIYAETTGYDQISFTSEAKTEVVNDECIKRLKQKRRKPWR